MAWLEMAFIVSGLTDPRDRTLGEFVYRFTSLNPVFLFDSLELKELIEYHARSEDPGCVVIVLLTGDDVARSASEPTDELAHRPTQNVVLALGYFLALLPADHVIVLREDDLVGPDDTEGVTYLSVDDDDWRHQLAEALDNLGVTVDFSGI